MQRSRLVNIIAKSKELSNKSIGDSFDKFKKSLPMEVDNNYRLEAAWKAYGSPKNYKDAIWEGLIQPIDENTFKFPSIGYNKETEEYEYLNKGRENETVAKDIRVWDNDVIPLVKELKLGGFIRVFDEEKDCWKYSKNKPQETQNNEQINFFQNGGPTRYNAGQKCKTKECALFSNGELRNSGYMPRGNAWNLQNVDILYSGYNTDNYPKNFNLQDVIKYNNEASDNFYKNFDSNNLDKDTTYIVNMYYTGSPAQERAYKEGRDKMTGTHTGYVTWNPNKNRWEVTHNIHGTIHVDPFTQIQGGNKKYGITGIFTPRKKNWFNQLRDILGLGEGGNIEYREEIEQFQQGGKSKPKFEDWYKTVPKEKSDTTNYDLEKAYNELPFEELEQFRTIPEKHLDGRFKKPNHITYSDEGYGWIGSDKIGWTFYPSPRQQKLYPYEKYVEYWNQYEPNSTLNYNGRIYKVSPQAFKQGGQMNVIPEGALHARKNNMELAKEGEITHKGVPVVDNNGVQQAEVEKEEWTMTKELTEDVEEWYKEYYSEEISQKEKDELAIKCGKRIVKELLYNTDDRTGLLKNMKENANTL